MNHWFFPSGRLAPLARAGARIALLNQKARDDIEKVIRQVEKIETAVEPKFQDHFVEAMGIPHSSDPYRNLSQAVKLPERRVAKKDDETAAASGGRRRRRR